MSITEKELVVERKAFEKWFEKDYGPVCNYDGMICFKSWLARAELEKTKNNVFSHEVVESTPIPTFSCEVKTKDDRKAIAFLTGRKATKFKQGLNKGLSFGKPKFSSKKGSGLLKLSFLKKQVKKK